VCGVFWLVQSLGTISYQYGARGNRISDSTISNGICKSFMQKDRLGSTKQILDETGQVLHTKSYEAFGKPRNRYRFSIQCVLLVSGIYPT